MKPTKEDGIKDKETVKSKNLEETLGTLIGTLNGLMEAGALSVLTQENKDDLLLLAALHAVGVENYEGYEKALELREEWKNESEGA